MVGALGRTHPPTPDVLDLLGSASAPSVAAGASGPRELPEPSVTAADLTRLGGGAGMEGPGGGDGMG